MESKNRSINFTLRFDGREAYALQRLGQVLNMTRGELLRDLLHQAAQDFGLLTPGEVADLQHQPQNPGANYGSK